MTADAVTCSVLCRSGALGKGTLRRYPSLRVPTLQVGRISVDQRNFPEMSEKIVRGHSALWGVAVAAL